MKQRITATKCLQRNKKIKGWFSKKVNKIDKSLENLTKIMRERPKLIKLEMKKGRSQQTLTKSNEFLGTILKTYIHINWKI
jgi:hypothetical protein